MNARVRRVDWGLWAGLGYRQMMELTLAQRAAVTRVIAVRYRRAGKGTYLDINPAAIQRQIHALINELLTLAITKAGPQHKALPTRPPANQATNQLSRASGI